MPVGHDVRIPADDYIVPFGQAHVVQEGHDLTVVTWGGMVERCELAAADVEGSIEIIDLRTLMPWIRHVYLSRSKDREVLDRTRGNFGEWFWCGNRSYYRTRGVCVFGCTDRERMGAPSVPVLFSTAMDGVVPKSRRILTAMWNLSSSRVKRLPVPQNNIVEQAIQDLLSISCRRLKVCM